jgi:hypothetical protein
MWDGRKALGRRRNLRDISNKYIGGFMNSLLRNKSVFLTLLVFGICFLGSAVILSKYLPISSINFLIPLSIGGLMGSIVCLIETVFYKRRCRRKYKPSIAPYIGFGIIVVLNLLFRNEVLGVYLLLVCGFYFITLGAIFKTYEAKTTQKWITWKDLSTE